MPPNSRSDQAMPPAKYTPLMLPKSVICRDLVDEDERDAFSSYMVGHRVAVHRQDRHPFPFSFHDATLLHKARFMPSTKEPPMLVVKEPPRLG